MLPSVLMKRTAEKLKE